MSQALQQATMGVLRDLHVAGQRVLLGQQGGAQTPHARGQLGDSRPFLEAGDDHQVGAVLRVEQQVGGTGHVKEQALAVVDQGRVLLEAFGGRQPALVHQKPQLFEACQQGFGTVLDPAVQLGLRPLLDEGWEGVFCFRDGLPALGVCFFLALQPGARQTPMTLHLGDGVEQRVGGGDAQLLSLGEVAFGHLALQQRNQGQQSHQGQEYAQANQPGAEGQLIECAHEWSNMTAGTSCCRAGPGSHRVKKARMLADFWAFVWRQF